MLMQPRCKDSPAEGATTSVELALRGYGTALSILTRPCEYIKARDSSRDIAIAVSILSVLPKPMSSARMPPFGKSDLSDDFDPRIAC